METQAQAAARMYDERAATYEDSWHPDYSRRAMARAMPAPPRGRGDRVLVLCCGTGLEVFLAADAGAALVVGVDASPGMLRVAEARRRERRTRGGAAGGRRRGEERRDGHQGGGSDDNDEQQQEEEGEEEEGGQIRLVRHDATDLDACAALRALRGTFDLVVCLNAFVLFADPAAVVRGWRPWLRAGGRMAVDITHERNLLQAVLVETAAARVGLRWVSGRGRWIRGPDSFRAVLEAEGLHVESVELLHKVPGAPVLAYDIVDIDAQFDYITNFPLQPVLSGPKGRKRGPGGCSEKSGRMPRRTESWKLLMVYISTLLRKSRALSLPMVFTRDQIDNKQNNLVEKKKYKKSYLT